MFTHPSCVDSSSITGRDAAAEQTHTLEWGIITNLGHSDLVDDSVLREGTGAHELQNRLTTAGETCCRIRHNVMIFT